MEIFITITILVIILILVLVSFIDKKRTKNINEWSYKRYADFYGELELADPLFNKKINTIKKLINGGETSIEFIAKESGCTLEECSLKINYLKNKRVLDNCYIDTNTNTLVKCSEEDMALVDKYKAYLYGSHSPLNEIIAVVPCNTNNYEEKKNTVIKELKYLIDNKIVNGVTFNEVDNKLIYYTIEKHNKEKNLVSIVCDKCGAINDVNYNSKVHCRYCDNIIEGPKSLKEVKK